MNQAFEARTANLIAFLPLMPENLKSEIALKKDLAREIAERLDIRTP